MNEQLTLAYLAGSIDADGFVTVQRTRKNVKANTCGPVIYYFPKVGLTQVTRDVPDLLTQTFGGSVYEYTPKNPKHRHTFTWCGSWKPLERIMPYLIIKKAQAKLCIELGKMIQEQWETVKSTSVPPYRITPSMLKQRSDIWIAVTKLNMPKNRRVHFTE